MSQNIAIKLDLEKIGFKKWSHNGQTFLLCPANRFYQGEKGTYLDLISFLNDHRDDYGNDGSVALSKKKEEKDQKTVYVGSLRRLNAAPVAKPTDDFDVPGEKSPGEQYEAAKNGEPVEQEETFDDLPF